MFPRESYLFLGKALPEPGNHLSYHACGRNPVLWSHGEGEVLARCRGVAAEVLQHVPGGIAPEHQVAEIHKGGMENPLGTKELQWVASAETCSFPGSERR